MILTRTPEFRSPNKPIRPLRPPRPHIITLHCAAMRVDLGSARIEMLRYMMAKIEERIVVVVVNVVVGSAVRCLSLGDLSRRSCHGVIIVSSSCHHSNIPKKTRSSMLPGLTVQAPASISSNTQIPHVALHRREPSRRSLRAVHSLGCRRRRSIEWAHENPRGVIAILWRGFCQRKRGRFC